ncbi:putative beta-L-arabinofuranosidase, GH127 [Helianthus annuus]|nr:putative beta-L-arabinofuranosidase, GH127 [Helianthus annuus]
MLVWFGQGITPESTHGQAQQTNLDYLLMLDVDSLVWSFRNTAGLPTVGTAYGGWESSDQELRGHFVGLCPSFNMASTIHHGCLDVCTWIDLCVL